MPAVSLVCPHCEKPVEVQVTGVTRSRPCPECGEMLMLQVAEKNKKAKRRALLMGGALPEAPTETTLQIPSRPAAPVPASPSVSSPALASASITRSDTPPPPAAKITTAPPPAAPTSEESRPPTGSQTRSLNFLPSHEPQLLPGDAFERMRMDPEIKEFRQRFIIGFGIVIGCIVLALLIRLLTADAGTGPQPSLTTASEAEPPALIVEAETPPAPVPDGSLIFKGSGQQEFSKATTATPTAPSSTQLTMDLALSIEALRKFLAAPDWRERLAWSRPVSGLEERMAAFYAKHSDGPVAHENIVESREAGSGFFEHIVVLEGGSRRPALVEKTPKGPRVDWAAFAGAGDLTWDQLMEERPITPVTMRVLVSDGFYYENQFGSPRLLKCLELRCPTDPGATVILGYIERDLAIAQQIEFWLKQSNGAALQLTLRLKYPQSAPSPKQVWVTDIVRQGWQDS